MRSSVLGMSAGFATAGMVAAGLVAVLPQTASADTDRPPGAGPVTIQSVVGGGVVDVDGGVAEDGRRLREWSYNASAAQQWTLSAAAASYRIVSAVDPAFCLGRESGGAAGRLVLRRCADGPVDWEFRALGGDRYHIKDPAGERYVHVASVGGGDLVTSADTGPGAHWYLAGLDVPRRAMPADPRLDQLSFLTAHNAMANTEEGFRLRFPNQSYRLADQLRQGVRGLQIDAHASRGQVRMCHGGCWGNERTLTAGLQDVIGFLNSDRSAVVTMFIEDYTSVEQLRAALAGVPGLDQVLFRPDRAGVRQHGWPRLSELTASNQRLLIFSQSPGREAFGVMHDRDWTVENYWSLGNGGNKINCYTRWSEVPLNREEPGFRRLHVMNHYRDIPTEPAAVADNGGSLRHRAERVCGPAARRKPNYVAVDFYQKPDNGAVAGLLRDLNTYW